MNDIREIKCEACPRVCPEDYQKMVEKYSRACQERDRANELLQKGQEKHRWIPVTERLPEDREDVMVSVVSDGKAMIGTGWYVVEKGRWYVRCITTCEQCPDITHWMPLPEPPEAALKGGEG